jgi:hypothetical protein
MASTADVTSPAAKPEPVPWGRIVLSLPRFAETYQQRRRRGRRSYPAAAFTGATLIVSLL